MRALTHPLALYLASALIIPAAVFTDSTDSRSLVLVLLAGVFNVWFAFAWALNLHGAWDRKERFREDHPTAAGLTMDFAVPRENGKPPAKSPIPSGIALGIWGLILTGIGIYGLAQFF